MAIARKNKTKKAAVSRPVILVVAAAGLLLLAGLGAWHLRSKNDANVPSPTPLRGNTTHDEPTPTPGASSTSPTTTATPVAGQKVSLAKPILQKSSGNAPGSSVPAGALIEFTCEGTPNLNCEVILTDRNDSNKVLNLGAKKIASNNRGQYFAIWDWSAVKGSWNVRAKVSDGAGNSALSDLQTLEVK